MFFIGGHIIADHFDIFVITLCAAVFGYIPALIITIVIFIHHSALSADFAYTSSSLLLAVIASYLPVHKGWYRSKTGTVHASLFLSLIAGSFWCLLLHIIQEDRFGGIQECLVSFGSALLPLSLASFLCYLFFNHAPEKLKMISPVGIYHTKHYEDFRKTFTCKSTSLLSTHLMIIIIGEAVLLSISAVIFVNLLLPKMQSDLLFYFSNKRLSAFIAERATLAFDLKMFLLMMNVTVPLCIFFNRFAQHFIAYPVRLMAKAM